MPGPLADRHARPRNPPHGWALRAADDAKAVRVFHADELPTEIAFDHREILGDYLAGRWGRS